MHGGIYISGFRDGPPYAVLSNSVSCLLVLKVEVLRLHPSRAGVRALLASGDHARVV
jgi:hypothetical protein